MVVFIVRDWSDIAECLKWAKYILYQVIRHDDKVELRVKAGRVGWIGEFDLSKQEDKRRYEEIIENLRRSEIAHEVTRAVSDDMFFTITE